ncbi:hypothetical protein G3N56_01935 [Desulfovibrio sulfodismutans]|uniref:Uncharacterized protein n=1 Tax=Desulfolutivibrio sulfodismutans TaxID=63561 RepID=A0A7K3NI88_9BACT|nr:hypothetical protein [Desulfolutivibrio sulfodismutans]NDY55505.1 hypothetical protein [Desulfolutivibrio sulfodismutans]QLA12893.1 hypothetical protein GD606_11725 [Desulfolutivibrio sulfodismutans DSM 3696]
MKSLWRGKAACIMPLVAAATSAGCSSIGPGRMAVHSGGVKPLDAFAAISFHGHWFWVDGCDLLTKRVFSFLMLAFTLMEEKGDTQPPQLTIPVQ